MKLITDKAMRAAATDKDQWIIETAPKGYGRFMGRITPTDERLFYFRYTNHLGKRITLPIGSYEPSGKPGGMTVAEARALAASFTQLYLSGVLDIKGHLESEQRLKKAQRDAEEARHKTEAAMAAAALARENSRPTVLMLFEDWARVDLIRRKDQGQEVRRMFEKDVLPAIGHIRVEDIRKAHITQVTDALLRRNVPRMAKVVFSLMRQMFRFAVDRDLIASDPSASLRKTKIGGRDVERDRVLTDEEIRLLQQRLPCSGLTPHAVHALWLCLSTSCRIGELVRARWDHIDLTRRTWLIPKEHSKNGKAHMVYLSDFALQHFGQLHGLTGGSAFCFPNARATSPIDPKTITKQIGDRQRETALVGRSQATMALALPGGHWTPHDLRRTSATIMVALGALPEVADRCLNHTEQRRILRTYVHHSYEQEQREAWQLLGQRLSQILGIQLTAVSAHSSERSERRIDA